LELADAKGTEHLGLPLPPQTNKTIGDTLSAKGNTLAWYAGGWKAAIADGKRPPNEKRVVIYTRENNAMNFQPHHQPFNHFARFAPGRCYPGVDGPVSARWNRCSLLRTQQ
jgi:phospholipase C